MYAGQTDRVTQHAIDVVEGKEISGKLHRLACQRHLSDLRRQKTKKFPYYYDMAAANDIIDFAETLTLGEGIGDRTLRLIPEQAFDLGCRLGWKKQSNNMRRFRRSYKSVARQNGKTLENGIMGTYISAFSRYKYGKMFTVATKKRQARLAWEEMAKFISADKDLAEYFKVQDYLSRITAVETNCTVEALSKEAGLDDGFRSIFSSIDEIHQHRDNKIYKALYNGTRALPETLISMITTRGDKLNSFCKEMDDYAIRVLMGESTAEDFFVDIYALDPEDNIWEEDNWIKANPYICRNPELFEIFKQDAQTAKDMGGAELRDFMTKSLNLWVADTDHDFIVPENWDKCAGERTLESFEGQSCYVGLDLSSGGDLTTLALEFDENPDDIIYLYSHSFMPRGRLEEHIITDTAPYDLWEQEGLITVTGGAMDFKNDYKFIIKHLKELKEQYSLKFKAIGIDPHNADGILSDLEELGCPVIIVKQSCRELNDPTVDMQLLIKGQKIEYDRSNELLTWSAVNARIVENSFGERKIDKKVGARNGRIDPIDAVMDAHAVKLQLTKQDIDLNDEFEKYMKAMGLS